MRLFLVAALTLLLAGCSDDPVPAEITDNLVISGLGGATLPGEGYWFVETIEYAETGKAETHHHFGLGDGLDELCDGWSVEAPPAPAPSGDPRRDCEAEAAWYTDLSAFYASTHRPGALQVWLELWDTSEDGSPAAPPERGSFTPIDGPDEDRLEWAGGGTLGLFDWYALVAEGLDCDAAAAGEDPWPEIEPDTQALAYYDLLAGTLTLDPDTDLVRFDLDHIEMVADDTHGDGEDGVLDGAGVFRRCEVLRVIEPSTITD